MKSKNQTLQTLSSWAERNNYSMKKLTSNTNNSLKMLKIEIAFINENVNVTAFIIEITRFKDGKWSLTSFKEMFETAHTKFNYIQELLKEE